MEMLNQVIETTWLLQEHYL